MEILVLNLGSSSIKFKLYDAHNNSYNTLASGLFDKIAKEDSKVDYSVGGYKDELRKYFPNHESGMAFLEELLTQYCHVIHDKSEIDAIGHRVVHGGSEINKPSLVDDNIIGIIKKYSRFAPLHNPKNLLGIEGSQILFPDAKQVTVFDTSFHTTIPAEASIYGLAYKYYGKGIKKYGFHGISHHYATLKASEILGIEPNQINFVSCHLGNGCSITAVKNGKSIDTSMGFTPLEGLIMGTRCGDIDPAAVFYIMMDEGKCPSEMEAMLNKESGMYGLAGVKSHDMRDIWRAADSGNKQAEIALKAFAHRVSEYIGGYAWHLGGDCNIVFTAGIGENDGRIRKMILEGQEKNGIILDEEANILNKTFITTNDSPKRVLVIPTDEELMIATSTYQLLN